jgi:PHP family Zn ribbon phosphoesterase
MAIAVWVYPGPALSTLRLSTCARCLRKYTDAANTKSTCPNCDAQVIFPADPT